MIGTDRPELYEGIRSLPTQSHVIYYRIQAQRIQIVRVLHSKQDEYYHLNDQ